MQRDGRGQLRRARKGCAHRAEAVGAPGALVNGVRCLWRGNARGRKARARRAAAVLQAVVAMPAGGAPVAVCVCPWGYSRRVALATMPLPRC
jgi:hypothetical protein